MNDNEQQYFNRWMQAQQEIKKLKSEIEKMKLLAEYNSNFKEENAFLLRETRRNETAINTQKKIISNSIPLLQELITLFDSHFLLNENISDVKLEKETMKKIINKSRAILIKSKKEFSHTHYKIIANIENHIEK